MKERENQMSGMLTSEQDRQSKRLGGLAWVVFFVFLILKLTGIISWSWWWVTCPLWIFLALGLALAVLGFILAFIYAIFLAIFGD